MAETKPGKSEASKREEATLKFWLDNQIFEKTLAKEAPKGEYVFYDGPPFATGLPHYGHILASLLKDAIPRYQTMRGHHVARRWGWDCHGLPIENLIEKELGLKTKKDIEDLGIEVFNQKARESVMRYAAEWQRIIPRIGRWVDMENDYKSLDPTYSESVWWAFKTLYDKGLAYEGYKSMHLCPRCETTLANFEVNQGYKDVTDLAVTVKFKISLAGGRFSRVLGNNPQTAQKSSPSSAFLLAWTTTPWTLPGNVALAVNPKTNYVLIKLGDEYYILAKDRLAIIKDEYEIVEEFSGKELVGQKYKPLFDYYASDTSLKNRDNGWQVYGAEFVTTEDGTGIVHIAPAFGEDDLQLGQTNNLPFVQHVGVDGRFKPEVKDFAGALVKPKSEVEKERLATDIAIIKYLQEHGTFFAKEKITHPYPHCWRCDTPLLNYASSSWFIAVTKLKADLLRANESIGWVPEHIKEGRFGNWLEGARDWAVSRSRFWGAPLPVWRCADCGKVEVLGSLKELESRAVSSGNKYWLMRHGEAENNVKNVISCRVDSPHHLTERGQAEVKAAADKLRSAKIDLIISSDLVRTKETTALLAQALGLSKEQVIFDERLREFNLGDFDGQPIDEYHRYFESTEEKFNQRVPNGENYNDLKLRMMSALLDLEKRYHDKNILIVSHDTTLMMLYAGVQGFNLDQEIKLSEQSGDFIKTAELRELGFKPLPRNRHYELDLHRPYIDELKLSCACGGQMSRVPEVFDVWFESGSMPYAQLHYPFEHEAEFKDKFPADFIAEGLDQTRGWFYVMLVLSIGLFGRAAYKRVVVNGLILAEDGQKMSKRLNNYPEVGPLIEAYGADALRWYLLSSPAVHGEELNFSERALREQNSRVLGRLRNVLSFYQMYNQSGNNFSQVLGKNPQTVRKASVSILDGWIWSRLNQVIEEVTAALESYELDRTLRPLDLFIDDLSTWYLRRSRERLKDEASTLRLVLLTLAKLLAPFVPFVAEEIYRELGGEQESVHLESWPEAGEVEAELIAKMAQVRDLVSRGLELRAKAGIKIRQPLSTFTIDLDLPAEYQELIKEEMNVEQVVVDPKVFAIDTNLTPELKEKGELRDLIREIQDWRKASGLKAGELALVVVPSAKRALAEKFAAELKAATAASDFRFE